MNDNRIWRPEKMTERDKKVMDKAIDAFRNKYYRDETPVERDERLSQNPNYIKKDGKWYDKRYMK